MEPYPALPPLWPATQVYTDRLRMFVRRSGRPDAPPLLLIHGLAVHGGMWQGIRTSLEPHFDLVVPDVRGHGFSSAPGGRWSVEAMADDFVSVLDRLGIDKVSVAGYSMGGFVALALAQQHPNRVERLGLLCAAPRHDARRTRAGLLALGAAFSVLPPRSFLPITRGLMAGPGLPQDLGRVLEWLLGYNSRRGLVGSTAALRRADLRGGLDRIAAPTLIVTAGTDVAVTERDWRVLIDAMPRAEHVHFDQAGHGLIASHAPELSDVLIRFFGDRGRR
jgi:3-oxoadipate enol-lactonase